MVEPPCICRRETALPDTYLLRLFHRASDANEYRCESHLCDSPAEAISLACALLKRARDSVAVEVWRGSTHLCRIGAPAHRGDERVDEDFVRRCARAWAQH